MRRRVTRCLVRIQTIQHTANVLANYIYPSQKRKETNNNITNGWRLQFVWITIILCHSQWNVISVRVSKTKRYHSMWVFFLRREWDWVLTIDASPTMLQEIRFFSYKELVPVSATFIESIGIQRHATTVLVLSKLKKKTQPHCNLNATF